MKLVLASTSAYRRMLLERLSIPFELARPDTDETPLAGELPDATAERLAAEKARAVATASMASLFPPDDALLTALLAGDEKAALARGAELEAGGPQLGSLIYGTTKRALALWIRRHAATSDWAGASIPLNGVAPGVVETPMTADLIATPEQREQITTMVPMPLNGIFEPRSVAYLLAWLTSEENAHLCGQIVFIDGGSDVIIRGDSTW